MARVVSRNAGKYIGVVFVELKLRDWLLRRRRRGRFVYVRFGVIGKVGSGWFYLLSYYGLPLLRFFEDGFIQDGQLTY